MPFYLIHKASLSRTVELIKTVVGYNIDVPGITHIMEPDLIDSPHAWDFRGGVNNGNIIEYMKSSHATIKETIQKGLPEKFLQRPLIFLNHYISDALSVGQTDARLWGIKDDLIDARMELVINKTGLQDYQVYMENPDYFRKIVRLSLYTEKAIYDLIYSNMYKNHEKYYNRIGGLWFWIKGVKELAVDCVDLSAILTSYLFCHAVINGGRNG